jgi:hypothetical protein
MCVLRAQEDGREFRSTHAYLAEETKGSIFSLHANQRFHQDLCKAFDLTGYERAGAESGLALIILYPHVELHRDRILAASVENFAPAIMNGSLVVLADNEELNATSIRSIASRMAFNDPAVAENVETYLALIQSAAAGGNPTRVAAPRAQKSDLVSQHKSDLAIGLQQEIEAGNTAVINLAFPLERNNARKTVCLTAALRKTLPGRRPIDRLFREGMSLPDVRAGNPGEVDLVILIDDEDLATYLNFCEGKAHLKLLESKEIKAKLEEHGFTDGIHVKRFVSSLPTELRALVTPDITEPDAAVFDEFFSLPTDQPGGKKHGKDGLDRKRSEPRKIPPPKTPAFRVETLTDGLRIRANPEFKEWPINLTVSVAYANGTRNPGWSEFDFRLEDLDVSHKGCELDHARNKLRAMNCGPDCMIEVRGFDANRELDTSIKPWRHAQAD